MASTAHLKPAHHTLLFRMGSRIEGDGWEHRLNLCSSTSDDVCVGVFHILALTAQHTIHNAVNLLCRMEMRSTSTLRSRGC